MKTQGYSIWLIPENTTFKILSAIIQKLSQKYSSPVFEPHVTLIGGISGTETKVIAKTKELATKIAPYKIRFGGVNFLDYYFKALFLEVMPDKEVMKVNKMATKIFDMEDQSYAPHLSLIYGDFSEDLKKEMIKNLKPKILTLSFEVNKIYLYKTGGEINDWKRIKQLELFMPH